MVNTVAALTIQTIQGTTRKAKPATIFNRLAEGDKTAVKDCIDAYGNLIWALSKKFSASREEAEAATQEIFLDIWRYSQRADKSPSAEEKLISMIALRRLMKQVQ